jgi:hypothetical protein
MTVDEFVQHKVLPEHQDIVAIDVSLLLPGRNIYLTLRPPDTHSGHRRGLISNLLGE